MGKRNTGEVDCGFFGVHAKSNFHLHVSQLLHSDLQNRSTPDLQSYTPQKDHRTTAVRLKSTSRPIYTHTAPTAGQVFCSKRRL